MCVSFRFFLFYSPSNILSVLPSVSIFMGLFLVTSLFRPCAYYQSPEPAVLPKSFAHGCLCYFVSGFEIQLKIDESVAPQDTYGKISNEQDVVGFKRSDSSLSILHKIWEYHDIDYQNKNHKKRLR